MIFPLSYPSFWLVVWCSAGLAGFLAHAVGRARGARALGLALMTVPLWIAFWGFIDSIPLLQDTGTVLQPASRERLSRMFYRSALIDLGYVGVGFLLWAYAGRLGDAARGGFGGLARRMREAGVPTGGRSEARSAMLGYLGFPLLLLGTWIANYLLLHRLPQLKTADESLFWTRLTPYHVVLISAAAAVTEEIVYRALLMGGLAAALRRVTWMPGWGVMPVAVVVQALVFGGAHGGYGSWLHVVMPLLFGLVAGLVAWRLGLWAAIVLHFLVDVYVLGAELHAPTYPWVVPALGALFAINVAAGVAYMASRLWRTWRVRAAA